MSTGGGGAGPGRGRGGNAALPSAPPGLLEIRAVAVRTVAIKGVRSSRYLCMDEAGRLHGQVSCRTLHPQSPSPVPGLPSRSRRLWPGLAFPEGAFHPRPPRRNGLAWVFITAVGDGLIQPSGAPHPLFSIGPVILVTVTA